MDTHAKTGVSGITIGSNIFVYPTNSLFNSESGSCLKVRFRGTTAANYRDPRIVKAVSCVYDSAFVLCLWNPYTIAGLFRFEKLTRWIESWFSYITSFSLQGIWQIYVYHRYSWIALLLYWKETWNEISWDLSVFLCNIKKWSRTGLWVRISVIVTESWLYFAYRTFFVAYQMLFAEGELSHDNNNGYI